MEKINSQDPFLEFCKWRKLKVEIHFQSLENGANQQSIFVEEVDL
jgi:hypothetical protein